MVRNAMQGNLKKAKLNFTLIYGSTRKNRLGIRFVKYLSEQIKLKGHFPNIVDPLNTKLPMLDKSFDVG